MKKTIISIALILFISFLAAANGKVLFQYKQTKGNAVSHVSTVQEEAYLNGRLQNKTEFINRTTTTIESVEKDGSAMLHTHYMTTQNTLMNGSSETLSWGEEDDVRIHRKANGELYESDNKFLPTVQNVPAFPDQAVAIGDSWQKTGYEVHDMTELFGMTDAIRIPFTATYKYAGDEEINGHKYQLIEVYYEFLQNNTYGDYYQNTSYAGAAGYAKQNLYWDASRNELDHFEEEFQIKMVDIYNNVYLFNGISQGEVTEYKSVNNEDNVKALEDKVRKFKLYNISVTKGEKGLTISMENIQFEPDSDRLLPSEQEKLKKIGELLKDYSNDLLITGHTALRGTEKGRQQLSEERAAAVANFLIGEGIRDSKHVFTQGKGAKEPIATNANEAGRSKNRRVEITIMD